jgi:hypothetical protein
VRQLIAVSSVGAQPASKNFYLSVKGEVEDTLSRLRFGRLDILRPGLLRGRREGPLRRGTRGDDRQPGGGPVSARFAAQVPLHPRFRGGGGNPWPCRDQADGRFVHEHDAILRATALASGAGTVSLPCG